MYLNSARKERQQRLIALFFFRFLQIAPFHFFVVSFLSEIFAQISLLPAKNFQLRNENRLGSNNNKYNNGHAEFQASLSKATLGYIRVPLPLLSSLHCGCLLVPLATPVPLTFAQLRANWSLQRTGQIGTWDRHRFRARARFQAVREAGVAERRRGDAAVVPAAFYLPRIY